MCELIGCALIAAPHQYSLRVVVIVLLHNVVHYKIIRTYLILLLLLTAPM